MQMHAALPIGQPNATVPPADRSQTLIAGDRLDVSKRILRARPDTVPRAGIYIRTIARVHVRVLFHKSRGYAWRCALNTKELVDIAGPT
jgi:hypothetical protein